MKKYITKQSNIKGAGKGLFTNTSFKKGEVIGLAHVDGQPYSEIGNNHNHNEKTPTAFSKKIDNKRYIFASRDLKPGEEITTNYRLQPELEQPEDFEKKKGGLVKQPKKYSRNLMAKNILFVKNTLLKKKKSVKNKIFDPNSAYFKEGGAFEIELDDAEIDQYRKGGYIVEELDDNEYQDGGPTSPEEWGQQIKDIEGQIGNPSGWTLSDYSTLQNKLNEYKSWRENTPEGQAVIDTHNEEREYDIPLPEHLQGYTNAMMKARLAYANEFGNPAAKRMINLPDEPYQFDNGDTGTHYMASMDNYAVPQIQDENGVLQLGDYGPESNEAIRFDSDEDANYFAENYKDVSPGFINQKKKGGASEQKIIFSSKGGDCLKDEYWNGTKCVKIPKNTRIVYHTDKDVYDKAFAAESDSSHFYNNAKSDFNKFVKLGDRFSTPMSDAEWQKTSDQYYKLLDSQQKKWHTDENRRDVYIPGYTANYKYKGPKSGLTIKPVGLEKKFYREGYVFPRFKKPVVHNVYEEPIKEEEIDLRLPPLKSELLPQQNYELQGTYEEDQVPEYSPSYPENRIGYDKYNWYTTKSGLPKRQTNTGGFYPKYSKKVEEIKNYMEGYDDEDGNYIPGEIEKAKEEGRQIKFKGNVSKDDKEAQEKYIQEYGDYENLRNYQNQIMNLMQYNLNQKQYGGLHKFIDGAQVKGSQGLNADFSTNLTAFINAAKADGIDLSIGSGFRSVEKQKQLWEQALKKYGSPEKARKWVAPPGKSNHNRGTAVDLNSSGAFLGKNKNTKATQWAHANAEKYGLHFRMGWEPWHIEPLNLSKEQKAKIDAEHQHSDNEDPNTHVDPNNAEALSKEGIDMTKYYKNLGKEQEITDIDNDYSNWNPQEEVVVDPRIAQLEAYSKLMSPSIQNVNDMYAATKVNQQQQQKQFAKGGHIELDADDNDINNYIKDGYFVEEVSSSSLPQNKNGGLNTFAVGGGGPCPKGQEWDEASQSCIDVLPEPKETLVPMVSAVPVEQPIQPVVETIQPETTVELNDNTVIKAPIVNNIETNEEKINAPSKNNYVIDTQRKLKSAGYDIGKSGPKGDGVDGIMGNRTRLALDAYNAGISPSKVKIPDPNVKIKGQVNDYKINSNIKDGYLPYLAKGVENCTKGKGCSANVSIKMSNLLGNITDESLWANDAWFNKSEVLNKGGDLLYENNEKDFSKMQNVPKDVWSKLQVGDYVELNRTNTNSSARFASQTKEGLKNEGIEHLGFVVGKDKDGTPLVWHGSETGKAYVQRIDQPLVLHDENKLTNSNTFTYKVSSIVRASALKNADFSGLQNSAYYTTLDPNKKLIPKKGATETQIQAVTTLNNSINKFKNLGYSQDDANYVGRLLIGGIMSNESKAGESLKRIPKEIAATIWKDYLGQGAFEGDEASIGYYQMKPNYNFTNKDGSLNPLGKKLEKLGVNVNDIESSDIDLQTKAGTLILLDNYTKLKEDPDFNVKTGLYKGKIPASYILAKSWQAGQDWYKRDKYKTFLNNFDVDYSNAAIENAINSIDSPYASRSLTNEYYKVTQYRAQKDKELQNKSKQETLKKITEQNKKEDAYIEANPNFRYEKQVPTESTAINKTYVKPINIPDYTKKKIIPGTIYKYAQRPGVKYKKDANGKWYVNSGKASDNKYVLMVDPSGQRAKVLEKGAQPFYSKDGGFITSLSKEEIDRYINGGYIDTELTDKEITNYKNGGYIVEYLD